MVPVQLGVWFEDDDDVSTDRKGTCRLQHYVLCYCICTQITAHVRTFGGMLKLSIWMGLSIHPLEKRAGAPAAFCFCHGVSSYKISTVPCRLLLQPLQLTSLQWQRSADSAMQAS